MDEGIKPQGKNKNLFVALILTIIVPGLGHLYKGDGKKTLLFVAVWVFGSVTLAVTSILGTINGFYLSFVIGVCFAFWYLFDVSRRGPRPFVRHWYNKWYVYVGYTLLYYSAVLTKYSLPRNFEAVLAPFLRAGSIFLGITGTTFRMRGSGWSRFCR